MKRSFFVIGDSISVQYGFHLAQIAHGVCDDVQKTETGQVLDGSRTPVGASTGDSKGALKYLREHAGEIADYDILLFNSGLHDIMTDPSTERVQVPTQDYEYNLTAILGLVHDMAVCPVWVSTTPVPDDRHNAAVQEYKRYNRDVVTYNNIAARVMGQANVPAMDLYAFSKSLGEDIYCDHVHFKEEVRRLQAAFIVGWLCAFRQ